MKEGDLVRERFAKNGSVMRVVEFVEGDTSSDEPNTALCQLENGSTDWFIETDIINVRAKEVPVPAGYSWEYEGLQSLKIDKNVPIPAGGKWKILLSRLELGDSVFIPLKRNNAKGIAALRTRLWAAKDTSDIRITTRVEEGGVRVWRIG
tara:strand:- start:689 stop:1138 length:450 start_codon:yes stop_codon:yes gene_type:complete